MPGSSPMTKRRSANHSVQKQLRLRGSCRAAMRTICCGTRKTYFMERLVRASLDAGRPAALVAPYGEQSRVTLRAEAEKARRPDVARAFAEANTVAWLLNKARFSPEFRG